MSIIKSEFPFIFSQDKETITDQELNEHYSTQGKTYPDREDAIISLIKSGFHPKKGLSIWEKNGRRAFVSNVYDHIEDQFTGKSMRILKGALVTHEGNEAYIKV